MKKIWIVLSVAFLVVCGFLISTNALADECIKKCTGTVRVNGVPQENLTVKVKVLFCHGDGCSVIPPEWGQWRTGYTDENGYYSICQGLDMGCEMLASVRKVFYNGTWYSRTGTSAQKLDINIGGGGGGGGGEPPCTPNCP